MRIEGHAEVKGMLLSHEGPQMKRGRESDPLLEYALGPRIDHICRTNVFPRDSLLSFFKKRNRAGLSSGRITDKSGVRPGNTKQNFLRRLSDLNTFTVLHFTFETK